MSLWGSNSASAADKPKYSNTAATVGVTAAGAAANVVAHAGWVYVQTGTGPVTSIAISDGGTGYANGDAVVAANTYGDGLEATVTTDGSGVITDVTITAGGQYSQAPVLTVESDLGEGADLTADSMGGRAGRVMKETLVAMGSLK